MMPSPYMYSRWLLVAVGCLQATRSRAQQCTLCIDGSDPPFPNALVFDFENTNSTTCADLEAGATEIPDTSTLEGFLACEQLQDVGLSNCGCITPDEVSMGCTLCPGGNDLLPDPEREIIRFVTCGGIANVVERFGESQCTAYQKIIGDFCGCPDAPVDEVCRICGGDQFVDFPAAFVDLSGIGLDRVPCAFYETISNDPEFAEGFSCAALRLDAPDCCTVPTEPLVPPDNLSELCAAALVGSSVDAYLECATTCSGGFCCGLDGSSSCFLEFAETCGAYAPCVILDVVEFPEGSGPLEPPEDLAVTCDAELIGSSLEAFVACAEVCLGGACCEGPCLSTEFFATCAAYTSCTNLDLVEFPQGGPLDPPDDLADLCSVDLIANSEEASLKCATACIGGACCEGACLSESLDTCAAYAPCANLGGDSPVASPIGGPTEEPTLSPVATSTKAPVSSTPGPEEPTLSPDTTPTKAPTSSTPGPEAPTLSPADTPTKAPTSSTPAPEGGLMGMTFGVLSVLPVFVALLV